MTDHPSVTVLGIGAMGAAFVRRLNLGHYPVVAWNRTKSKAEELIGLGNVTVANDAGEAITSSTGTISLHMFRPYS